MLIGEVAKLANLSKDGIRHYEQLGLIASTPRSAGRRTYRDYDASVLEVIDRIRQAQQLGLSLREIGPLFEAYAAAAAIPRSTVIEFLEARLGVVRGKIAELQEIETFICRKIAGYRAADPASCPPASTARRKRSPQP